MNKIMGKLVNKLKGLLENCLQLLKHRQCKIAIAMAVAAAVLAAFFWPDKIEAIASLLTLPIALVGLYILHQRMKATEQQTEVVTEQTRNAARQIKEDRFAKAFEQIGNGNLAVRLGGLNLLDTIAREGQEEYKRVWDYLASFLRHPPPLHDWRDTDDNQKPVPIGKRPDIAEIAKMLWEAHKRYRSYHNPKSLNLSEVHLKGSSLHWAHLEEADLQRVHFEGASLQEARLDGTYLMRARLEGAYLYKTSLKGAHLIGAHLEGADLSMACLKRANLMGSKFDEESNLDEAIFQETNVSSCDFSKVKGLTKEQFQGQVYVDRDGPPKFPSGWQLETSGIKKITGAEWWKIQKKHREKRPSN